MNRRRTVTTIHRIEELPDRIVGEDVQMIETPSPVALAPPDDNRAGTQPPDAAQGKWLFDLSDVAFWYEDFLALR